MTSTNTERKTCERNPELGAIAIVVAFLWMTLFGLAAFAVDIGYGYTNKRGLKAVADASVRAGMKTYATSDRGTSAKANATAAAQTIATQNGFPTGVTVTYPTGPNRLQVEVQLTQPTYFLKLFGMSSKLLTVKSSGEVFGTANALLLATGGCATQGLKLSSNAGSIFNGNIWSNGPLDFDNGPTPATVNGDVQSACPGYPRIWSGAAVTSSPIGTNIVTGSVGVVGTPFTNPYAAITSASFTCSSPAATYGTLGAPFSPSAIAGAGPGGTSDLLAPGVYCSGGDMVITDAGLMAITATGATFVALGKIVLGMNNAATLTPAQNNIVLFSADATGCGAGQAINIGFNNFDVTGGVYAPNGCVRIGGGSMELNGSVVGRELFMAADTLPKPPWVFGTSGGGSSGWQMYE